MLVLSILLLLICQQIAVSQANESTRDNDSEDLTLRSAAACDSNNFCATKDYGAHSAYVPCSYLPLDFIDCDDLIDHQGNATSLENSKNIGCLRFGGTSSKGRVTNCNHFLDQQESNLTILFQMSTWVHDFVMQSAKLNALDPEALSAKGFLVSAITDTTLLQRCFSLFFLASSVWTVSISDILAQPSEKCLLLAE